MSQLDDTTSAYQWIVSSASKTKTSRLSLDGPPQPRQLPECTLSQHRSHAFQPHTSGHHLEPPLASEVRIDRPPSGIQHQSSHGLNNTIHPQTSFGTQISHDVQSLCDHTFTANPRKQYLSAVSICNPTMNYPHPIVNPISSLSSLSDQRGVPYQPMYHEVTHSQHHQYTFQAQSSLPPSASRAHLHRLPLAQSYNYNSSAAIPDETGLSNPLSQNVESFQNYRPKFTVRQIQNDYPVFCHTVYPTMYNTNPVISSTSMRIHQSLSAYPRGVPIPPHQPRQFDLSHTQPQLTASVSIASQHVYRLCSQAFTYSPSFSYPLPIQSMCCPQQFNSYQQLMASSQPLQYPQVATPTLSVSQTPILQACEQTFTQQASSSTFQTPSSTVGACSSLEQSAGTTVSYSQTPSDGLSYSIPHTCSQLESIDVEYPQEPYFQHSSSFESQQIQTQHDVITDTQSPSTRSLPAKRQTRERRPEAKKVRLTHHQSSNEDCLDSLTQAYSTTSTDGHTQISNTLTGPSTSQQNSAEPPPLSFPTDFHLIYETLYPARPKWYKLGLALKLSPPDLESIDRDNRGITDDCFREVLETRMKKLPKLTWREIIQALRQQSVGERELGFRIKGEFYHHGQTSSEGNLLATDPASNPPECVVRYANYLKDRYKQMSVLPDDDWPPPITSKQHFTNLALIERKKQCPLADAKFLKTMEYDYAHGNVDNIVDRKQRIEFEQVFLPIIDKSSKESRLTILMDGAPGVGKTTIIRKVCVDWANGKILQEYQLVIFVPLREVTLNQVENHTITDLLPADDPELKAQIIKHIQKSSGTNILFLFDGFDELSTQQRTRQSLFLDIIKGNTLYYCSVLVTSRSYASGPLKKLSRVNRHVEVLGFTKKQIRDCVKQNIAQKDKTDQLLQMLKDRLDISSLCYIPLNCRIVLYVYSVEFTLPDTLTQLYDIFILHTIKHHAEKIVLSLTVDLDEIQQATGFKKLPDLVQSQLDSLSQIAFSGMKEDKLVFECAYLKNSKDSHLSLGLLNSIETFTQVGRLQYYQFLHLTIQEFLAARYIASDKMSAEERLAFLRTNVENKRFRMTLLFLAGLTHFDFLPPKEAFPGEKTISLEGRYIIDARRKDKPDKEMFLFLAQLFYETRASSCDWLLSSLCLKSFNMSCYSLTQFDCLVLVHFLSTTPQGHIWEVIDLSNCKITADRFRILSADHTKKPGVPAISMTKVLNLDNGDHSSNKVLNLYYSSDRNVSISFDLIPPIISKGYSHLVTVNLPNIKRFGKKQNDCSDALKLAESLVKNKSLQDMTITNTDRFRQIQTVLHLSGNRLTLTGGLELSVCPKSFQLFLECLTVETLEELSFSERSKAFQDCPHCGGSGSDAVTSLCQLIDKTTNLQDIGLSRYELSDRSLTSICTALAHKTTLKYVNVDGNSISVQDIERLVKLLPISTKLTISGLELTVDDQTYLHVRVQDHRLSSLRELLHHNKSIVVLNASACELTDNVLKEISDYLSHKSSLRELNISGNFQITSEGWEQFFRALQQSTTDVQHSYQSGHAVKVTSKKIPCNFDIERTPSSNQSLEILNVSACYLTDEVLGYIATCLTHNTTLTELHLGSNRSVTSVGWIQLFRVLEKGPTAIRKLIINNNKLETEIVKALGEMLCGHKRLEMLGVSECFSSDDIFEIFTNGLFHNKTLKEIDISRNREVTCKGWEHFFRALQSADGITTLDISSNSFGYEGLSALRELLHHNKSIVVLNVGYCYLTDDVLKDISDYLSHKSSLRELDISYNEEITSEVWEQFFRALQHNTSLKQLNIKCFCSLTSDQRGKVMRALSELITHNKGISELTIDVDFINNEYELFARALLQNTTLQLLRVLTWSNVQKRLTNEIKRLRQEEGIIVSPDWNLKIVEED